MEYTKGDWRVIITTHGRQYIMSKHNKVIADIRDMEEDVGHDSFREFQKKNGTYIYKRGKETVANAYVMAASTKLLAACKAMIAECDCCPSNITQAVWDNMETAIAATKGE